MLHNAAEKPRQLECAKQTPYCRGESSCPAVLCAAHRDYPFYAFEHTAMCDVVPPPIDDRHHNCSISAPPAGLVVATVPIMRLSAQEFRLCHLNARSAAAPGRVTAEEAG